MFRIRMKRLLRIGVNPIEISIVKWKDVHSGLGLDRGGSNCSLCYKYHSSSCYKCPLVKMNPDERCSNHGSTYKKKSGRAMIEVLERARLHQLLDKFGVPDVWKDKKNVKEKKKVVKK